VWINLHRPGAPATAAQILDLNSEQFEVSVEQF